MTPAWWTVATDRLVDFDNGTRSQAASPRRSGTTSATPGVGEGSRRRPMPRSRSATAAPAPRASRGRTSSAAGPPRTRSDPVHVNYRAARPAATGRSCRYLVEPLAIGTPPRRRRGRGPLRDGLGRLRNTPASEGRTRFAPPPRSAAHGSPSCRRGGPGTQRDWTRHRRIIPVSAGRTMPAGGGRMPCADHPRVGGEGPSHFPVQFSAAETPSRRRGGLVEAAAGCGEGRSTPASAGRAGSGPRRSRLGSEHPPVSAGRTHGTGRRSRR